MSQTIYLAAMVVREERLLLVRPAPEAPWELPGGMLLPEHEDVDAGMDAILSAMGVNAPAIEEDFVHTIFMAGQDGPLVYNIYAPSEWFGEPAVPDAAGSGWFALEEVESIEMDDRIRSAILEAYGMREPGDDTRELLSAMGGGFQPFLEKKAQTAGDISAALAADYDSAARRLSAASTLDARIRGLQAIAILAALRSSKEELRAQVIEVLNAGASPDQVFETLRVVGVYAGFPAARRAAAAIEEIFATRGIQTGDRFR
jgi:alkylhydroperoxidase/carboxymuconolactone decarboxylase family protein YurZ